jgi:hypothetical protein
MFIMYWPNNLPPYRSSLNYGERRRNFHFPYSYSVILQCDGRLHLDVFRIERPTAQPLQLWKAEWEQEERDARQSNQDLMRFSLRSCKTGTGA